MALATATITYNLSDNGLVDFDPRRTKVWATNNIPGSAVIDTLGDQIHLGQAKGTLNADGTGSIVLPIPGAGSNPVSWQWTIHVDYPNGRERGVRDFGPFTITASGDLADLVPQQEIPPEYASTLLAQMQALRDQQTAIAGLTGEDAAVANLVGSSTSATRTALAAAQASLARRVSPPPRSLLRQPAPVSPTLLTGDTFGGTAGTSLAGRSGDLGTAAAWTVASGTWQLDGAGAVAPTTATDGYLAVLATPAAVQPLAKSIVLTTTIRKSGSTSANAALVFRYVNATNFWYFTQPLSGSADWRLYKVVNGSHTVVFQFSVPTTNGAANEMRVDLWGRDITLYLDGVEIYTLHDTTHQSATSYGVRQGITGGYGTPISVSDLRVTTYAGAKFNVPRVDAGAASQIAAPVAGTWEASDCNNPNVVWDPVNARWVLYYSGYKDVGGPTIQGMGLAYSSTLDGTFVKDPANPRVPAATGNIENGGLIWVAGRWLRKEDLGKWYTSPDLNTWTEITPVGLVGGDAGDPFLRINENGLLEYWYGVGIPATSIRRAVSADGGLTWDDSTNPVVTIPSWLTARGHGEPSVYVPPGKEGVEALVFFDSIVDPAGHGSISAGITVDGGATWHFHQIAAGSGSGFDAYQRFDSFPVVEGGVFYLFHATSPIVGGEVNLQASIARLSVQWSTETRAISVAPTPYQ